MVGVEDFGLEVSGPSTENLCRCRRKDITSGSLAGLETWILSDGLGTRYSGIAGARTVNSFSVQ